MVVLLVLASQLSAQQWSLASPDTKCVIDVSLDQQGRLTFEVSRAGQKIVESSPMGIVLDSIAFDSGLKLIQASDVTSRHETYDLITGPATHVDHVLNSRSLDFEKNGRRFSVELAASDDGVAFRYRIGDTDSKVHIVTREVTGFAIPSDAKGWMQPYHNATAYTPAYEDYYFHVSADQKPPHSRAQSRGWAFPALFNISSGANSRWALLTESGTDSRYCACHLSSETHEGIRDIAFPLPDETTKGVKIENGPEPRSTLPWTMPWRVIEVGDSAGTIATSTFVTDLAPPSRIADMSWIKTGRASWAWWSHPKGPATEKLFNAFSDFAARMGWEYTTFDAGWRHQWLKDISDHARAEHVRPLAWSSARDFYDPQRRWQHLDEMVAAGVVGLKVDFWCSDRQEAIAAQQALMKDAADRDLLVILHGCTLPRGWQRTWPNFISAEAVMGEESYMYDSRYPDKAAELDTVLPFTRNAVGPMDLTPVGGEIKQYARKNTMAHELAASIIFTSGIIHYADKPEFYESLCPEAIKLLRDAPAQWDETRCLIGEPGRIAVFSRRSGQQWFIAGINGTAEALSVDLDLSSFSDFPKRFALAESLTDPLMQVAPMDAPTDAKWHHDIPARGGFVLRLER